MNTKEFEFNDFNIKNSEIDFVCVWYCPEKITLGTLPNTNEDVQCC